MTAKELLDVRKEYLGGTLRLRPRGQADAGDDQRHDERAESTPSSPPSWASCWTAALLTDDVLRLDRAFQHPDVIRWYRSRPTWRRRSARTPTDAGGLLSPIRAERPWACRASATRGPIRTRAASGLRRLRLVLHAQGWLHRMGEAGGPRAGATPPGNPLDRPGGYDFEVGDVAAAQEAEQVRQASLFRRSGGDGEGRLPEVQRRGTAFHYLHQGDIVRKLISNGPAATPSSRSSSPPSPRPRVLWLPRVDRQDAPRISWT